MKKSKKITFFIVAGLILVFTFFTISGASTFYGDNRKTFIKGVSDIRWGIDIKGGVEAVFSPEVSTKSITKADMAKAEQIIKLRLANQNITDYELNTDENSKQIIVRFPWQTDEKDFDPNKAVQELGAMAELSFAKGSENSSDVILTGKHVKRATYGYNNEQSSSSSASPHVVQLEFDGVGKQKFAEATTELAGNGTISIWLDDQLISSASVNDPITDGQAIITGDFTVQEATELANTINAGSLPFTLSVDDSMLRIVSPSLGSAALNVMLNAGLLAFALVCIMMLLLYRLPGFVSIFSLTCQIAGILACASGFLPFINSSTMTIPGLAGIILSIGMGVDANVINAERVKDEVKSGRTIDGALNVGFERGFGAIMDGNVTVVIVAAVLMSAFGPPDGIFAKIFGWIFVMFDASITGDIYSFGFTLLIGTVFNLIAGVWFSNAMVKSLAQFRTFRKPWYFGGAK